jgi:lipopolysaccharide export system protein LptA
MMGHDALMKRLLTLVLAIAGSAASLAPTQALAQLAGGKGPIDVTADQLEMVDAQHLAIWRGNVEALQDGNRLVADVLNVYFSGKTTPAPGAPPPPAPTASAGGALGSDWGDVQRLVADGHVFYVTKDQTARGDHAVYEAAPDTIVMTGEVVLVQGQNVVKGDRMTIDVKTNHAQVFSDVQGRNHPERVRGVFYNANNAAAAPAAGAAPAAPAAGSTPAKP